MILCEHYDTNRASPYHKAILFSFGFDTVVTQRCTDRVGNTFEVWLACVDGDEAEANVIVS